MKNISVRDAEWIATLLSQLSDQQIRDAFRAANYSAADVDLLAATVRDRAEELASLRPSMRIGSNR
jgi:hypothetical protein